MFRRTFIKLFGAIPFVPKPACSDGPRAARRKENGCWEAPGFYATFICMKCGGKTGSNNVTACGCTKTVSMEPFKLERCNAFHWSIGSVHIGDEFVFYHKPPNKNCIMGRNCAIVVVEGDELVIYRRDEKNGGKPKIVGTKKIREAFSC